MSNLYERTIARETVFKGKVVQLETQTVELPNGRTSTREVVLHPGAVAVLAEPEPGKILCVRQYRKAPDAELLEIPAGKLETGEEPLACAMRELQEETGFRAHSMKSVYSFFTSPGFANEKIHLFYTNEMEPGDVNPDEDEFVETEWLSRDQVTQLLNAGAIEDAKTLIALSWWLQQGES